ncbi:MAG: hypothetical protein GEV12_09625 [Micromonosporaceae bacterium]|nr:hypothetical protein [Micromonosporaceae bacterium]
MSQQPDDRVLGFPAFPPSRRRGGGRPARWWARAWLAASEDTLLSRDLLTRGRRYANAGQVGSITITPGQATAPVHDGDPDAPHRTSVLVEPLTDGEWDRFLDRAASRAGYVAGLLARDLPRELVSALEDAGVRLAPGIADLVPECSCPDSGFGCVHAAALCYQVGWLLDPDPFRLLLLRGRGERELLAELPHRTADGWAGHACAADAVASDPARPAQPGVPAAHAYAQPVPPLPPPPPRPAPVGSLEPPVAAAAARARALLQGDGGAGSVTQ